MDRVNEILISYKYPLLAALVGVVLLLSGSISSIVSMPSVKTEEKSLPKESMVRESATFIKVDIAGAVNKPGVYELPKDKRIEDLLISAGGFTADVNAEYVSKNLNLSQKISDGQKIYIPFKNEPLASTVLGIVNSTSSDKTADSLISINNATQSELESLAGVGPSTSSKIIAGRPYESLTDLLNKKVVGKALFEKIKDQIEL